MICYRCIHSEIIFLTVLNKDTKLLHISHSLRLIILLVNGKALFQPFLEKGSTYSPIYLIYGGQLYNSPTLEEEHISQYLTEALPSMVVILMMSALLTNEFLWRISA